MEHWGTPALTLVHEEDCWFNTTLSIYQKCFKTFNKLPDIPFSCNLYIKHRVRLYQMLLKGQGCFRIHEKCK